VPLVLKAILVVLVNKVLKVLKVLKETLVLLDHKVLLVK
jgi:hypothetical protein